MAFNPMLNMFLDLVIIIDSFNFLFSLVLVIMLNIGNVCASALPVDLFVMTECFDEFLYTYFFNGCPCGNLKW